MVASGIIFLRPLGENFVIFNGAKLSKKLKHCSPEKGDTGGHMGTGNIPLATTAIPASCNYHSNYCCRNAVRKKEINLTNHTLRGVLL